MFNGERSMNRLDFRDAAHQEAILSYCDDNKIAYKTVFMVGKSYIEISDKEAFNKVKTLYGGKTGKQMLKDYF